jgi:L-2-hydroxyglutarate oxidase
MRDEFDYCIIGGGIVGFSTAYLLSQKFPKSKIILLEKESNICKHQTGRNSGVIHSGIYYKPGSQKALNCRSGKKSLEKFCLDNDINFEICGKVIVATNHQETPRLQALYERGVSNGVECELISKSRLLEIEPHANGVEAIHVKECGIINYTDVCQKFSDLFRQLNGSIYFNFLVKKIKKIKNNKVLVSSDSNHIICNKVINCAGLYSDDIARLSGGKKKFKIIPFKGEYFKLKKDSQHLCKNLIYPTPNPQFPFLGVHFTRGLDRSVECGPNAVLAFGKEAYGKLDFNLAETFSSITFPGFLKMASKHWRMGLEEMYRSYNKKAFVKALKRLVPEIDCKDIVPFPSGIRAQALDSSGNLIDDFVIDSSNYIVNVYNAPSPAATSCLSIAKTIISKI